MARITETVFVVARPDGTSDEFTAFDEAAASQAASPGAQLRTRNIERDVPADYAVMVDGEILSRHDTAREASVAARSSPGAEIVIWPKE